MQKFKHKLGPTNDELNDRIDKKWLNMKRGARKKRTQESARIYREESATEKAKVDSLIADWTRGGHGHMDLKKSDGIFRILWENYNSLQILTDSTVLRKMRTLDAHRKKFQADLIAGCETQTNWYQVPDGQRFEDISGLGEHKG